MLSRLQHALGRANATDLRSRSRASLALSIGQGSARSMSSTLDLSRVGRRSYVSQNGLAQILKDIKAVDKLPEGTSKSAIKRARQKAVRVDTPYGPLIKEWSMQKVDGTEVSIKYLCPAASLWQTLTGCDRFREHFASALEQHACSMTSKWSIVLYSDEVSPGNQLKSSNKRRLQTFYWALKQMGPKALSSEDGWFLLTTVRTATVSELVDGLSQVTKECILRFSATLGIRLCRVGSFCSSLSFSSYVV